MERHIIEGMENLSQLNGDSYSIKIYIWDNFANIKSMVILNLLYNNLDLSKYYLI